MSRMGIFPFEILEEILQNLRPSVVSPDDDRLAGGFSGFGIINNWWTRPKRPQAISQQATYEVKQVGHKAKSPPPSFKQIYEDRYHERYKALLPLRLVNRGFYDICTPYVFQELNLFNPFDTSIEDIVKMYGVHVRILRISMDKYGPFPMGSFKKVEETLEIIRRCPGIQTLALYYAPHIDPFLKLIEPFLLTSEFTNLDTIGIYFPLTARHWSGSLEGGLKKQIARLASSERAHVLKQLDVALPFLSGNELEVIRTKFTSLEWLTIHGNLSEQFAALESSNIPLLNWSQYGQLTTLRLIGISAEYIWSMRLSEVVRASRSIAYLFVSDMGQLFRDSRDYSLRRSPGWSTHGDSWWNRRKPLAELHLKAVDPQVVYHLGTIPVSKVWLTFPTFRIQDNTFVRDAEIFPQMQKMTMKTFSRRQIPYSSRNPDILVYAQTMYTKRGVTVEGEGPSTLEETSDPLLAVYNRSF
ncbi:hypothetical protein CPB86DRAFT_821900 [Serendipita vermifera]|nr:hypothetical protein CPB86DRAFT_821900 [Serendipita vermifera]